MDKSVPERSTPAVLRPAYLNKPRISENQSTVASTQPISKTCLNPDQGMSPKR